MSLIVTPSRRTNDETEPRGRAIVFQQSEGLSGDKLKALEANISKSQTKVDTLDAKILVGNTRIQQFSQKAFTVIQDKNGASIGTIYPTFGEHRVRTMDGGILAGIRLLIRLVG